MKDVYNVEVQENDRIVYYVINSGVVTIRYATVISVTPTHILVKVWKDTRVARLTASNFVVIPE